MLIDFTYIFLLITITFRYGSDVIVGDVSFGERGPGVCF